MMRLTRVSTTGLLARHVATRAGGSVLLALLLAFAVAALAVLPSLLTSLADDEFRHEIGSLSALRVDVNGSTALGAQRTGATTSSGIFGNTDAALRAIPQSIPSPLGDLMGEPSWVAQFRATSIDLATPLPGISPEVRLSIDLEWADRVVYVAGAAPSVWLGSGGAPEGPSSPIEVAISQHSAAKLALSVGDEVGSSFGTLRVSGIVEPADATADYWTHAADLLDPVVIRKPGSPDTVIVSAYIDPLSSRELEAGLAESQLRVWYPTRQASLEYAQTGELLQQIQRLSTVGSALPNGQRLVFQTGLTDAVDRVVEHVSTLNTLLGLAGSAPLGVVLAALLLGVRTVVLKRRPAVELLTSRGASDRDARLVMAMEGAVVAIPAFVVGIVVAALLAGPPPPDALIAPALLAAAVPLVLALSSRVNHKTGERGDLQSRTRSRVRWIAEVATVGVAGIAYLLLARRGVASSAAVGIDPLLVATPLLLSIALCVVVLRIYPLPLLAVQRWSRRRRGVASLLGSARAVREPALGVVAVVAMLAGVSTAVFSLVLAATVTAGLEANASTEVGADARIDSSAIAESTLTRLRAVPGVEAVAALQFVRGVDLRSGSRLSVTLVIADTRSLHAVRPDLPALVDGIDLQALVSSDLADEISGGKSSAGMSSGGMSIDGMSIDGHDAVLAGFVAPEAIPGLSGSWVLVDSAFAQRILGERFQPTSALINTGESTSSQLGDGIPEGTTLIERSSVLAESVARPSVRGLGAALVVATVLAAAMAMITLVLAVVGAAPSRRRLIRIARVLGMSRSQVESVVAWEIAPVAFTAVVAGVALGLVLPLVVLGVVDLRALIGGISPVAATIPWLAIAGGALGFCALVTLAGVVSLAVDRRADRPRQARMGER